MGDMQAVGQLDRAKYIGGSDIAAIMGLSPWKSPLDVFNAKRSGEDEPDAAKQLFFKRRKRQEPVVAEILTEEYGVDLIRLSTDADQNRYIDSEHGFLAAEIDFEFRMNDAVRMHWPALECIEDGVICNGEIKTVHPFKSHEWGEEGSEDVPVQYAAQTMHGIGITGRPACLVAALFGVDNLVGFPILRDDETIAGMRAKAVTFWHDHILTGIPPDPITWSDISQLYSKFCGRPVELTAEFADRLYLIDRLRKQRKLMETEIEAAELELAIHIAAQWGTTTNAVSDDALILCGGEQIGSWKKQRGTYLNQKQLKEERPEIIDTYTVEHWFRVFRLKSQKSK